MEQIQLGKQDIVFAGGGEEEHWALSCLFDAMGALSSKYNDTPEKASRTYDADRDGFVISGAVARSGGLASGAAVRLSAPAPLGAVCRRIAESRPAGH